MSTIDTDQITNAEQLLQLPEGFGPCELVRGKLIMMTPAGAFHGRIGTNLLSRIATLAAESGLGLAFGSDTGFILERNSAQHGDTVCSPDVAFVRADRIPAEPIEGFFPGSPDLAGEIRSPHDRTHDILTKIALYLELGVQVVWDVDPKARTIMVYRPATSAELFREGDTLTEKLLLPGFSMAVEQVFAW